jgi:hypothetical protein
MKDSSMKASLLVGIAKKVKPGDLGKPAKADTADQSGDSLDELKSTADQAVKECYKLQTCESWLAAKWACDKYEKAEEDQEGPDASGPEEDLEE